MLLQNELSNLVNEEIAVIMADGNAYRGKLKTFDSEILILEDIYETSTHEIDWVETDENGKSVSIKGFVPWRKVTLPKLIVRMDMVLRIWPWKPGTDATKKTATKPTKKAKKTTKK